MNKPLKSIARISVVDQAIQNLQNYITENSLQPGDKLPTEKEVCEMMESAAPLPAKLTEC